MNTYIVVTTVIEKRVVKAETPEDAVEVNNATNDHNYTAEVPARWVEDLDGNIVYEE